MRDFIINADDIKDLVHHLTEKDGIPLFDELRLESLYRENLRFTPTDPWIVLFKPAQGLPWDPLGVVSDISNSGWRDVDTNAVILVMASRYQLERVQFSIDKTLYVDTSFNKTK